LILPLTIAKPMRTVDGFFASALDTMVQMFKPPFAFREFLLQTGFVARACADHHAVDPVHRSGGAGIVKVCIDEAGALTAAVVMCWRPRSSTPDDSGKRVVASPKVSGALHAERTFGVHSCPEQAILLAEYVAAPTVLGGGAGNVSGRKSRKPSCLFGLALRSHSALVDRVDGRDRLYLTSPVSKRSEV
jgi:hypothetical protein